MRPTWPRYLLVWENKSSSRDFPEKVFGRGQVLHELVTKKLPRGTFASCMFVKMMIQCNSPLVHIPTCSIHLGTDTCLNINALITLAHTYLLEYR